MHCCRAIFLFGLACGLTSVFCTPLFGAELSFVPFGTVDIVSQSPGGWSTSTGSAGLPKLLPWGVLQNFRDRPAPIDANGWPTCDAYIVVTLSQTWSNVDPSKFLAHYGGDFTVSFRGSADVIFPPQMDANVSNATFDNATYTTSLRLSVPQPPPGGLFAIVVGVSGSRRNASAPLSSGITDLSIVPDRQLAPSRSVGQSPAATFWGSPLLRAVAPLHHVRFMQWTFGWYVTAPFTTPAASALPWEDRALMTDAVWQPGYVRPRAFGAPWETVILLAQESPPVGVWINVPVEATGDNATDVSSYVYQLALLLRDGNALTGGAGVPLGAPIYIEHSNEVWLNGSAAAGGGPSLAYTFNKAAAAYEVAHDPASNLNSDSCDDPETWAYRRHARRVLDIARIFQAVFGADRMLTAVRPVLGWSQTFSVEGGALLAWLMAQYGSAEVKSLVYGIAVNAYCLAYVPAGSTLPEIFSSWDQASDAQVPLRNASLALASSLGLRLLSYEGSLVGIPADDAAINATTAIIIEANRAPGYGVAMQRDFEVNWPGGEFNFFALASQYGEDTPAAVFQWGLTEDLGDLGNASKYSAVLAMLQG